MNSRVAYLVVPFVGLVSVLGIEDGQPRFGLPYDHQNENWNFTGGPHEWGRGSNSGSGLDFAPPTSIKNARIHAVADGEIVDIYYDPLCGNTLILQHDNGWQTMYCHMESIRIVGGTKVRAGQEIGIVGSSGRSTGVHLHLELMKDGRHISWDGREMGGWRVQQTGNYDGYLERDGLKVEASERPSDSRTIVSSESDRRIDSEGSGGDGKVDTAGSSQECSHLRATSRSANCHIADESFLAIEVDFFGFEPGERLTVTEDFPCLEETFSTGSDGSGIRAKADGNDYWSFRKDFLQDCGSGWYTQTLEGKSSGHVSWIKFYWGE